MLRGKGKRVQAMLRGQRSRVMAHTNCPMDLNSNFVQEQGKKVLMPFGVLFLCREGKIICCFLRLFLRSFAFFPSSPFSVPAFPFFLLFVCLSVFRFSHELCHTR